ncbi:hypothetical protein KM043_005702 [Ampulex compressa]|nr:hypothetical protein KM043_005702 [Ampulex compressa]
MPIGVSLRQRAKNFRDPAERASSRFDGRPNWGMTYQKGGPSNSVLERSDAVREVLGIYEWADLPAASLAETRRNTRTEHLIPQRVLRDSCKFFSQAVRSTVHRSCLEVPIGFEAKNDGAARSFTEEEAGAALTILAEKPTQECRVMYRCVSFRKFPARGIKELQGPNSQTQLPWFLGRGAAMPNLAFIRRATEPLWQLHANAPHPATAAHSSVAAATASDFTVEADITRCRPLIRD